MSGDHRLPIGTVIAGHTIEQVLGQGGFGITYRVRNNTTGELAALKEYFPSDDADRLDDAMMVRAKPDRAERFDMGYRAFLAEARTLNSLPEQRGLIRIQGAFTRNNTVYALMDFIDGEPLDRAMKIVLSKRKSVPMPLLQDLIESMLGALRSIHEVDVLHRDIKPANVMISREGGQPVLIDFGAARPMSQSRNLASMFSRRYAALEQFPSRRTGYVAPGQDSPAIDIFGFSTLLYELVSQSLPQDAEERFAAFRADGKDPYVPVRENLARNRVPHRYPDALLSVIDRGCALFPTDRISSARVMAAELGATIDQARALPAKSSAAPVKPVPRPRPADLREPATTGPKTTDIGEAGEQKRRASGKNSASIIVILIIIALAGAGVAYGLMDRL